MYLYFQGRPARNSEHKCVFGGYFWTAASIKCLQIDCFIASINMSIYNVQKLLSHPTFPSILLPSSLTFLWSFKELLNNSSPGFMKDLSKFLFGCRLPFLFFIFFTHFQSSPCTIFRGMFYSWLLSYLTWTYESFKHKKKTLYSRDELVLPVAKTDYFFLLNAKDNTVR